MNEGEIPPRNHSNLPIGLQMLCQPPTSTNYLIFERIMDNSRAILEEIPG